MTMMRMQWGRNSKIWDVAATVPWRLLRRFEVLKVGGGSGGALRGAVECVGFWMQRGREGESSSSEQSPKPSSSFGQKEVKKRCRFHSAFDLFAPHFCLRFVRGFNASGASISLSSPHHLMPSVRTWSPAWTLHWVCCFVSSALVLRDLILSPFPHLLNLSAVGGSW